MIYNYRGWRITVIVVKAGDGWSVSTTVRAPGAHRSAAPKEVVPPVTATSRESALDEVLRRTHEWIDRYAFGEPR
jgi:hypothetical protein